MSQYFSESETFKLDQRLVDKLDRARGLAGIPFIITSGYRTPEESFALNGISDSAHTKGMAVDLRCQDGSSRYKIVLALLDAGFKRVGIETLHIHADIDDDTKPSPVIFLGESK